jgi:hypothetical protein
VVVIVTDDFVYLHLPKTGGTFVERVLSELQAGRSGLYIDTSTAEGREALGARDPHGTVRDIPPEHRGKRIICTCRNPFDQYVSQFEFAYWKVKRGAIFHPKVAKARFSSFPDLTFDDYLAATHDMRVRRADEQELPDPQFLHRHRIGFNTWLYLRFAFHDPHTAAAKVDDYLSHGWERDMAQITWLPMEELNLALERFLIDLGYEAGEVAFIRDHERVSPPGSRRTSRSWKHHYTADLEAWVRDRDRLLFAMFPDYVD